MLNPLFVCIVQKYFFSDMIMENFTIHLYIMVYFKKNVIHFSMLLMYSPTCIVIRYSGISI